MPSPGLSLVGFMDQNLATQHLANACIPPNPDPAALQAEWVAAKARLGAPIPNAGTPRIGPIPATYAGHIQAVQMQPAFQMGGPLYGVAFQMVEIDPLLAFQFTVDLARSAHHCSNLSQPPTLDELMGLCLPTAPPSENIQMTQGANSVLLKARSLNVQTFAGGFFNGTFMGIQFGVSLPFVHVVRHNGRCYLHNGFHRVVGARNAGAVEVPCVFRDVLDHPSIGIRDGVTFSAPLLESPDPPTVAHLTQGRAHGVQLRSHSRVINVSWSEYAVPDE